MGLANSTGALVVALLQESAGAETSQGFGFVAPQNRLFLNVKLKFVIVALSSGSRTSTSCGYCKFTVLKFKRVLLLAKLLTIDHNFTFTT